MNNSALITFRTFRRWALPLALALTLPVSVSAQETGAYAGFGAGRSFANIDTAELTAAFQSGGYQLGRLQTEENDYNFKVLLGYNVNPNIALETSYFSLGSFDYNASLLPTAEQRGEVSSVRGFALDLVGSLPVRDRLSAFVLLGINNAEVEQDFSGNTAGMGLGKRSDRGWNEKYGIGMRYAVNDIFSLRAELERWGIENNRVVKDRIDTFTITGIFHFASRRPTAPATPRAEAGASAPTPAPRPTPPSEPEPIIPIEVTLTASTHFDFDRSELRAEGRQVLDDLVEDMRTLDYEIVLITGHTDRIGTRSYNIALSERRAEAVKNYLVSAGIAAARITTRGVNSDEPLTRPDQCRNTGSAQAQIACLQPDRRVVVLVTGTDDPE